VIVSCCNVLLYDNTYEQEEDSTEPRIKSVKPDRIADASKEIAHDTRNAQQSRNHDRRDDSDASNHSGFPGNHSQHTNAQVKTAKETIAPADHSYAQPQSEREMDTDKLCGRCYRSLRTYSETSVRLNQKKIVS
jgi:hypothetical protein